MGPGVDEQEAVAAVEMPPEGSEETFAGSESEMTAPSGDEVAPVGTEETEPQPDPAADLSAQELEDQGAAAASLEAEDAEPDAEPEAELEPETEAEPEPETEAEPDAELEPEPDAGPEVEPEAGADLAQATDAEPAEGEPAVEGDAAAVDRQWFVVHGYSGYENRVKKNLEQRIESMGMQDKIFQVVVPTEEEIEIRGGERRIVERRVFPGYILVEMVMDETSWYVVRNTPGVTGFVGSGSRPTPLSVEEVAKIMKRIESAEPTIKVSFKVGQQVRLTEGAFADFVGRVDDLSPEKGRAKVLVSMFGRDTPVEIDILHLERV